MVHAPRYPDVKQENWWVLVLVRPVHVPLLKKVKNLKESMLRMLLVGRITKQDMTVRHVTALRSGCCHARTRIEVGCVNDTLTCVACSRGVGAVARRWRSTRSPSKRPVSPASTSWTCGSSATRTRGWTLSRPSRALPVCLVARVLVRCATSWEARAQAWGLGCGRVLLVRGPLHTALTALCVVRCPRSRTRSLTLHKPKPVANPAPVSGHGHSHAGGDHHGHSHGDSGLPIDADSDEDEGGILKALNRNPAPERMAVGKDGVALTKSQAEKRARREQLREAKRRKAARAAAKEAAKRAKEEAAKEAARREAEGSSEEGEEGPSAGAGAGAGATGAGGDGDGAASEAESEEDNEWGDFVQLANDEELTSDEEFGHDEFEDEGEGGSEYGSASDDDDAEGSDAN